MAASASSSAGAAGAGAGAGGEVAAFTWRARCQMGKTQGEMAVGADGLYWRQDGWAFFCVWSVGLHVLWRGGMTACVVWASVI